MVAPSTRLARRLGLADAVTVGLGAMVGAGVFAAIGPAAGAAGGGLLIGLALAAVVALCNASSSARLAARYPESGGTYVYGRERLGDVWGYLAGWGFVVGKTASCAAMALTFGAYAAPSWPRPVAVAAVLSLTALNTRGVHKTARLTRVLVAIVLVSLATMVAASLIGADASASRVGPVLAGGWAGILESAGLLFFAFAGYARIATLGEEVIDPVRTIPRAIAVALGITLVVYAAVASAALAAVGPAALAASATPLATAVQAGSLAWLSPAVRLGGTVASLGVLLSLLVGVSRTTFAMAARGDLPAWLDRVHPLHQVPHRAELAVGALVVAVVTVADLRGAIGFSSFAVLTYYGVANTAAFTLPHRRRRERAVPVAGALGCGLLALTLPTASVAVGVGVLAMGLAVRQVRSITARGEGPRRRRARRGAGARGHRLGGRRPPRS